MHESTKKIVLLFRDKSLEELKVIEAGIKGRLKDLNNRQRLLHSELKRRQYRKDNG